VLRAAGRRPAAGRVSVGKGPGRSLAAPADPARGKTVLAGPAKRPAAAKAAAKTKPTRKPAAKPGPGSGAGKSGGAAKGGRKPKGRGKR
jgi:hypothetical protein